MTAIRHSVCVSTPTTNSLFDKKIGSVTVVGVIALHGVVGYGLMAITPPLMPSDIPSEKITPPLDVTFISPPPKTAEAKIDPDSKPQIIPKFKPTLTSSAQNKNTPPNPVTEPSQPVPVLVPVLVPVPNTTHHPKPSTLSSIISSPTPTITPVGISAIKPTPIIKPTTIVTPDTQPTPTSSTAKPISIPKIPAIPTAATTPSPKNQVTPSPATISVPASVSVSVTPPRPSPSIPKNTPTPTAVPNYSSNVPVVFSSAEGLAHLRNTPKFTCNTEYTRGKAVNVSFYYVVSRQGRVTRVTIAASSGNPQLDSTLRQQASTATFSPFTNKEGVPVVGAVTLPFNCQPAR